MININKLRNVLLYGFVLWAVAVFYGFVSGTLWAILHLGGSLLGWAAIIAAALGLGSRMRRLLDVKPVTFIEDVSVSMGLGLGALYLVMLVLGALHMYNRIALYSALLLMIFLTAKDLHSWGKSLSDKWRTYSQNRFSFIGALFLIIIVVGLAVSFIGSITLPAGDGEFSVSLDIARRYVIHGGIYGIPYNYMADLPCGMTMLYVLGLMLYGPYTARLVTFLFILLIAVSVYSMTRKFFHRKIALFATTIAIFTPLTYRLFLDDHAAIGNMFFSFMAFYSYVCWMGNAEYDSGPRSEWLVLSGIFAALSLSWGFYSLFIPLVIMIMVLYRLYTRDKQRNYQQSARKMLYFVIPFFVMLVPVFIKNLVLASNPVFPFFADRIGKNSALYMEGIKSLWGYLYPLWYIYLDKAAGSNLYYMGLVYILFLPAIILVREIGSTIRVFLACLAVYLIIYTVAGRNMVFIYPLIPILSIITAYVIVNLYGQMKYFYQFVMIVFLLSICANFHTIWPWLDVSGSVDFVMGYEDAGTFLESRTPQYHAAEFINKNTPGSSKILLVAEKRSFYIDREAIYPGEFSREPFVEIADKAGGMDSFLKEAGRLGITHMLVNDDNIERLGKYHDDYYNEYVREMLGRLTSAAGKKIYSDGRYSLYEL
ncbi:MAG: hypothetical protein JXJ19_07690 [Elusimicrobia bacterium]|nr:hypothetical protein [Elusimicrobiota bacterium]